MSKRILSLVSLLLIVSSLFITPALPARAAGQFLWWDDTGDQTFATFSAGEIIQINTGQILYLSACPPGGVPDAIYPYADIYIVRSGSVSLGSKLEDVAGDPNTVLAAQSGIFMRADRRSRQQNWRRALCRGLRRVPGWQADLCRRDLRPSL